MPFMHNLTSCLKDTVHLLARCQVTITHDGLLLKDSSF